MNYWSLPKFILSSKNKTLEFRSILALLFTLSNTSRRVRIKNQRIADELGISIGTVKRVLSQCHKLHILNYIYDEESGNYRNLIINREAIFDFFRVKDETDIDAETPFESLATPEPEKPRATKKQFYQIPDKAPADPTTADEQGLVGFQSAPLLRLKPEAMQRVLTKMNNMVKSGYHPEALKNVLQELESDLASGNRKYSDLERAISKWLNSNITLEKSNGLKRSENLDKFTKK